MKTLSATVADLTVRMVIKGKVLADGCARIAVTASQCWHRGPVEVTVPKWALLVTTMSSRPTVEAHPPLVEPSVRQLPKSR